MLNKVLYRFVRLQKDSKFSILMMLLAALAIGGMMVAFFPSFADMGSEFDKILESFPPALLEAFNITDSDYTKFEAFMSSEYYGFFWAAIFFPFQISWFTNIAKESEKGTLAYQLTYGISRIEIYISNVLDVLFKSFLSSFAMVGLVVLLTNFIDVDINLKYWVIFGGFMWLLFSSIGMFTLMLNSIFLRSGKVVGIMSGVLVGSYFLNFMSLLFDEIEAVKYISFFHYYGDPKDILLSGEIQTSTLLFFGLLLLLPMMIGYQRFSKSDLPNG